MRQQTGGVQCPCSGRRPGETQRNTKVSCFSSTTPHLCGTTCCGTCENTITHKHNTNTSTGSLPFPLVARPGLEGALPWRPDVYQGSSFPVFFPHANDRKMQNLSCPRTTVNGAASNQSTGWICGASSRLWVGFVLRSYIIYTI